MTVDSASGSDPMARARFVTSAVGLLSTVDPWRDDVLDRLEVWKRHHDAHGGDLADVELATGLPMDPAMAAVQVAYMIQGWLDGGAQQLIWLKDALTLRDWEEGDHAQRLVWQVVCMLEPPAQIELEHGYDEHRLLGEAAQACRQAATLAQAAGNVTAALDALDVAAALTIQAALPIHVELSALALAWARAAGDPDRTALQAMRHGASLHAAAERGACARIEVLDALEAVLRHLPGDGPARRECVAGLGALSASPHLHALRPWLAIVTAGVPAVVAEQVAGLEVCMPLSFDGDAAAFEACRKRLTDVVILAEDERVKLLGPAVDHKARADWATWSLRHDAFRSAVPHGRSFERERDVQQLMLVLNHELTHILSMSSGVGLSIMSLRSALTEVELELWTAAAGNDADAAMAGIARGPAPLTGKDPLTLARVERGLEMMHKLQMLQEIWAPWFEGVAITQEFADPRDDRDAYPPALSVLMGMVDGAVVAADGQSFQDTRDQIDAYLRRFEAGYGDAVQAQGAARQFAYLRPPDAASYLPAIVLTRSLLAGWRRTLGQPLTAAQAGRILLHLTRFGTDECVPDLGLPVDSFRAETIRLHLDWVAWAAGLRADQLHGALGLIGGAEAGQRAARWKRGELVAWRIEDEARGRRLLLARLSRRHRQAYGSLCGRHAHADRVANADPLCRAVLQVIGEALARVTPSETLAHRVAEHYLGLLRVLPVGQADGPFWLFPARRGFHVLVRTTERHHVHGTPDYNGLQVEGLEAAAFDALVQETQRLRHGRMRVSRFVDLVPAGHVEGRGVGRHFLVFEHGDWSHMVPAGLLLGQRLVADSLRQDIEQRLRSTPLADLDMRFLSDPEAGARRALDWLAADGAWALDGQSLAIDAWAEHVQRRAESLQSASGVGDRRVVGTALLRLALGPGVPAERALDDGLGPLCADDAGSPGDASRLLFATGHAPVALADGGEALHWPSLFAVVGGMIDVRPPAGAGTTGA